MRYLLAILLLSYFSNGLCQKFETTKIRNGFKLVEEFPLDIALGFEVGISKHISSTAQVGVLTPPHSTVILSLLSSLGTDQATLNLIKAAFKFGIVSKVGINYNIKRSYIGIFGQSLMLQAADVPTSDVEAALGINLSSSNYPKYKSTTGTKEVNLTLHSSLLQLGLIYGHRFRLNNRYELALELAVSKNVGSYSSVYSPSRDLSTASTEADNYLKNIYSSYAYISYVGCSLAYKLGK